MKLKNKDMQYYINTYVKATQNSPIDLNILILYKIRKNFQNIENALKPYVDTLKEIVSKSNGDKGMIEKINDDINQLGEQEVDVDISEISISDFGDTKVSPDFVNSIFFMLKDWAFTIGGFYNNGFWSNWHNI